jgi:hippurate hydrolase
MGGAEPMVKAGVMEGVDEVYGYHCTPHEEFGKIFCPDREMLAHVAEFEVTVKGRGGHGATPHLNRDPIIAASQMINSLCTVLAYDISCHDKATLTVCSLHGGTAANVQPETCKFTGTIRDYSQEVFKIVNSRFREIVNGIAKSMGVEAEIEFTMSYPATVNHPENA